MRHPLNLLLRIGRSDSDRLSILGDLEETYRTQVRPNRAWVRAQIWYAREVLAAAACSLRDGAARPRLRTGAMSDVRYALRRWKRRPGFAATAILTLTLGIAGATATFSIVDAVLLRPLPWADPATLVVIHGVYPDRRSNPATAPTWNRGVLSFAAWDALRTSRAFESVAAWRAVARLDTTFGENRRDLVRTMDVSSAFLPLLGVRMAMGRSFNEKEDDDNTDGIILTHETWVRRFGARRDVGGERVMLGSASAGGRNPKTIVGVIEPGFRFEGEPPEILLPVGVYARAGRAYPSPTLRLVARLAPGVSAQSAEAAAVALVAPTPSNEPVSARVAGIVQEHLGAARQPLWLLFGGAGLLLLIACANVAGLLLGEARVRRHEIAVRAALGGSRLRVVRQLVVEHVMMAALAVIAGVVLAGWLIGAVIALAPEGVPRIETVRIDVRAAIFATLTGLATLLIFGVSPALSLARTPVARTLAEGGRDGAPGRLLGQRAVVIAEIALALVLLTGAGLFAETMRRLTSQPLGFNPRGLAVIATTFTGAPWGDARRFRAIRGAGEAQFATLVAQLRREMDNARNDPIIERLEALPGVASVAGSSAVPFFLSPLRIPIVLERRPDTERHDTLKQAVTARYFETLDVRLLEGRLFTQADVAGVHAAVVSRQFARQFFPEGAINRKFRHVWGERYQLSTDYHIVGIVNDVKRQEFSDDDRPLFYVSDRQAPGISHFLVRGSGDVGRTLPSIRQAINELAPQLVVTSMANLEDRVSRSVAEERFRAILSSLFGASALVLAAVGLYGLIARRAADRRREFGVRMALGARPADVGSLVIRDAAIVIALGLAVGLPAAYAAAQITRTLLYGVSPTSPQVFAVTAGMLCIVAIIASLLPARRASRVDPIVALRS